MTINLKGYRLVADPGPLEVEDAFGPKLRQLRLRKGVGLRELARSLNLSPGHLSLIEQNARPSLKILALEQVRLRLELSEDEYAELTNATMDSFLVRTQALEYGVFDRRK